MDISPLTNSLRTLAWGQLDVTGDVSEWYRSKQDLSYYVDNLSGKGVYPKNSQKLVEDLLREVEKTGDFEFSRYNNEGDGIIDLLMWGLFTLVMFFATLKKGRGLQVVFISLAVLFFLLTAGELTGIKTITVIAGYEGIFTGLSAVYVGLAEVINGEYGRKVLPV